MLTHLQLKNFKGWKDTTPIRIAPLTVLFGTNSSGKSSIEQFLLMLKQTVDSSDRKLVLYPGDANTPVNLGSFQELIFGRELKNRLAFSFGWQLPERLKVIDRLSHSEISGNEMLFSADVGTVGEKQGAPVVHRFEYVLKNSGTEVIRVWVERKQSAKTEYKLDAAHYVFTRTQGRAWPLGPPTKFYGFPDQVSEYYQNADFVKDLGVTGIPRGWFDSLWGRG